MTTTEAPTEAQSPDWIVEDVRLVDGGRGYYRWRVAGRYRNPISPLYETFSWTVPDIDSDRYEFTPAAQAQLQALIEPAPSSGFDFLHPALPEVAACLTGLRVQGVLIEPFSDGYPAVYKGGEIETTVFYKGADYPPRFSTVKLLTTRALTAFALLLAFALPALAEPCKVNVRTCAAAECAYLPGIGPSKGAAIEAAHPADEAALDAVPGIGEATLVKIRPHVTYTGPTTCTSKQTAPKARDGAK